MNTVGNCDKTKKMILDRRDRDAYIKIIWENIQDDKTGRPLISFEKNHLALINSKDNFNRFNQ